MMCDNLDFYNVNPRSLNEISKQLLPQSKKCFSHSLCPSPMAGSHVSIYPPVPRSCPAHVLRDPKGSLNMRSWRLFVPVLGLMIGVISNSRE